jgi:hypothetical protein
VNSLDLGETTLLQMEFLHLIPQGIPGDTEKPGCLGLIPPQSSRERGHQGALILLERNAFIGNLVGRPGRDSVDCAGGIVESQRKAGGGQPRGLLDR